MFKMNKFVFEFYGTKEDFLNKLSRFSHNGNGFYYFDDYIVKIVDDEIHFGIERAGHSNGYWYIPTITERNGKTEFRGEIKYIGSRNNYVLTKRKKPLLKRLTEITVRGLLYVLMLPFALSVFLIVRAYEAFRRIKRKLLRQPATKIRTKEDKLFDLMETHLDCVRK